MEQRIYESNQIGQAEYEGNRNTDGKVIDEVFEGDDENIWNVD